MSSLEQLLALIRNGSKRIHLTGLNGSSKAYLLSRLILSGLNQTFVYVAPRAREAVRIQQDLEFFLKPFGENEIFYFPPHDVLPFTHLSPHSQISSERLKTLASLVRPTPPSFVTTTVAAVATPLMPRSLLENPLLLRVGQEIDRNELLKKLTSWGYQNVPIVADSGNLAVRGALLDLYGPLDRYPIRMEWMGDTIESIRFFDPASQRSLESLQETRLIPVREVILDETTIASFVRKARQSAEEKDLPRSRWAEPAEKVKQGIPFPGIETYLPFFYDQTTTFWDWLPKNTIVVADDFRELTQVLQEHEEEVSTVSGVQETLLSPHEVIRSASFQERLPDFSQITLSPVLTAPDEPTLSLETETHQEIRREIERNKKGVEPLAPLAAKIKDWLSTHHVFLAASSRHQAERWRDLLLHYLPSMPAPSEQSFTDIERQPGTLTLLTGEVSGGFRFSSDHLVVLTDEEVFGAKVRRAVKETRKGLDLSSFAELKDGDPIVHKEHGIGLYRGLIPMQIEGSRNDFLVIEFQGGDKLYLPVYRLNLVQRYTGADGRTPRLDKMGGASWAKIREKSTKVIRELAGDLLNLYAARTAGHKIPFSPPNDLFESFEASFPYEETPDQDRAITEVLKDMEKDKPMDRLVLGDVGYGKTEVAMRAAFKAVLDGKQVAVLVPTTLLAFQHFDRFTERFKDYPVVIDMLSRFRSPAEQKATIKKLIEKKVDIIIATHRLLQPDISFKDLGLLIIDEEHRFGVEQKEKVKRLKKNVDVLALSATPIPRTLHMSLVGLRSISVIETPPTDRLAIRTFVMPFEEEVIKEAILRELKRGGQVFFVHNEIETIGKMKEHLQTIVPEAKIEIGHGQMEEDSLEKVMIRFFHQEFNLLLCTTIIESGIDIPTANTIVINNADRFGLAQVYQLRGRVGRAGHRAYAYLLVEQDKKLTSEATQRLSVLQRFSDLGSGYKMASYDLEIRGAGNLLGTDQSGQMNAIGYELYTELLEKAIAELKGEKILEEIDPELHFKLPAFLPDDYIPDPPVRLELYRRLSSLAGEEEIDAIEDELRDRFGSPPPDVENLLELSAIKALAKRLRIKQIRYDGKHFVYTFDPSSPLDPDFLLQRITREPKRYKLTPDHRFIVISSLPKPILALAESKKLLRELNLHLNF